MTCGGFWCHTRAGVNVSKPAPRSPRTSPARRPELVAGAVLVLAGLAAYVNSFSGPLVFDDIYSISLNGTIRQLATALSPPGSGITVSGRPLLNLSFALNYAISGLNVGSYHALNLLIHLLAGLTLFGIVRRTLSQPIATNHCRSLLAGDSLGVPSGAKPAESRSRASSLLQSQALPLAFAVALLWTLHPLQTESVTYVVQRSESLMGLFYLLTLYCFIRGAELEFERASAIDFEQSGIQVGRPPLDRLGALSLSNGLAGRPSAMTHGPATSAGPTVPDNATGPAPKGRPRIGLGWFLASVLACLLGMATKEVVVSAPVMVLLYDRTFLAGSFRAAWRRRGRWYLGLAATWLLLAYLVVGTGNRGGTAGFGVGVGFWQYAATQFEAVARYLRLAVWPHPLIIDYGASWVTSIPDVVPYAAVLAVVVAGTAVALWRRPALGFLGAWFFTILAPTSLVPGIRQTIVEHRMYLALAPVIVLLVLGLQRARLRRGWVLLLAVALGWGGLTAQRNHVYRSDLALWSDTAARRPGNNGVHINLGNALLDRGRAAEALAQFEEALRLQPDDAAAYYNAANALVRLGRLEDAIGHFQAALHLQPAYFDAHTNLGETLLRAGRIPEAVKEYATAVRLEPDLPEAHYNLGNALARAGRGPDAVRQLQAALRLRPDYSEAYNNLGNLRLRSGRMDEAMTNYAAAIRANPANAEARLNLGGALAKLNRLPEAAAQYDAVLHLRPDSIEAAFNLGAIYFRLDRLEEARGLFERVLRLQPDFEPARRDLARVDAQLSAESGHH